MVGRGGAFFFLCLSFLRKREGGCFKVFFFLKYFFFVHSRFFLFLFLRDLTPPTTTQLVPLPYPPRPWVSLWRARVNKSLVQLQTLRQFSRGQSSPRNGRAYFSRNEILFYLLLYFTSPLLRFLAEFSLSKKTTKT